MTVRVVAVAVLGDGAVLGDVAVFGDGAVLGGGAVLAARRARPPRLAGLWEFPGGKVEPGEDDRTALVRECREELGAAIVVGALLGSAADDDVEVVLYAGTVAGGSGAAGGGPTAGADHDELRWLRPDEFASVRWLPLDEALLPAVEQELRARPHARVTDR